jgi:hypothetical protein
VGKTCDMIHTGYSDITVNYIDIDTLQLEVGTVATAYEPYIESMAHVYPSAGELRKVGTVADEIDLLNGTYTKRISEWTEISGNTWASMDLASYVNFDIVTTSAIAGAIAGTSGAAEGTTVYRDKNGIPLTELGAVTDDASHIGKYFWSTTKTVNVIVAKGAYANIAAARVGLGTSTLLYQLATPVVSKLPQQVLNAFQGGSLIVEGVLSGAQKPNAATNKIDITGSSTSPASSIEYVYRHDVQANGEVLLTDVTSSCTLTDSGTTITITGVDTTKVYSFGCITDYRYNPGCDVTSKVPLSCARHDYGAAATAWTLTTDEANADVLVVSNAGGAADIVAPAIARRYVVVNRSGQAITIKKSGGTGVEITDGTTVHVAYNGTDYVFVVSA